MSKEQMTKLGMLAIAGALSAAAIDFDAKDPATDCNVEGAATRIAAAAARHKNRV